MSDSLKEEFQQTKTRIIYAPWEKGFDQVLSPFERFVKHQATAGLLLMSTALIALILANTTWGEQYRHMLHVPVGMKLGEWQIEKSIHHWINDGLMTLFFFVVGLELKREILVGELSNIRLAALPIIAAFGGMVVPALIYFSINSDGDASRGWGIPMATDIAFALGVIALLADRVPKALITFLVALAIVDDLGAIVIIALFYTEQLDWQALIAAALITAFMGLMNLVGVRRTLPYFIVGFMLWLAMMESGVHATLAGVISAFAIPALPKYDPQSFSERMRDLIKKFDRSYAHGDSILKNQELANTVQAFQQGIMGVETPLQRLEHTMHAPVAFLILPLFAMFNAGVEIDFSSITDILSQPVVLGVSMGLSFGKFIGVLSFSWLAVKLGFATLPASVSIAHIAGAALLAGIGFTMSIFIAELAFSHQPELITQAKMGIIIASVLMGVIGYLCLYVFGSKNETINQFNHEIKK